MRLRVQFARRLSDWTRLCRASSFWNVSRTRLIISALSIYIVPRMLCSQMWWYKAICLNAVYLNKKYQDSSVHCLKIRLSLTGNQLLWSQTPEPENSNEFNNVLHMPQVDRMAVFTLPWGLTGALLASTYLHSIFASASPSINVGLKTSFSSAPYLLELLYISPLAKIPWYLY